MTQRQLFNNGDALSVIRGLINTILEDGTLPIHGDMSTPADNTWRIKFEAGDDESYIERYDSSIAAAYKWRRYKISDLEFFANRIIDGTIHVKGDSVTAVADGDWKFSVSANTLLAQRYDLGTTSWQSFSINDIEANKTNIAIMSAVVTSLNNKIQDGTVYVKGNATANVQNDWKITSNGEALYVEYYDGSAWVKSNILDSNFAVTDTTDPKPSIYLKGSVCLNRTTDEFFKKIYGDEVYSTAANFTFNAGASCVNVADNTNPTTPVLSDLGTATKWFHNLTYLAFGFSSALQLNRLQLNAGTSISKASITVASPSVAVEGSNDTTDGVNGTWTPLGTITTVINGAGDLSDDLSFVNNNTYTWYRIINIPSAVDIGIAQVRLYKANDWESVGIISSQFDGLTGTKKVQNFTGDIDAIVDNGVYIIQSSSAKLPLPTGRKFIIETFVTEGDVGSRIQTARPVESEYGVIYSRSRVSNAWTDWIATSGSTGVTDMFFGHGAIAVEDTRGTTDSDYLDLDNGDVYTKSLAVSGIQSPLATDFSVGNALQSSNMVLKSEDPSQWTLVGGATYNSGTGEFTVPEYGEVEFFNTTSTEYQGKTYTGQVVVDVISGADGILNIYDSLGNNSTNITIDGTYEVTRTIDGSATYMRFRYYNTTSGTNIVKLTSPKMNEGSSIVENTVIVASTEAGHGFSEAIDSDLATYVQYSPSNLTEIETYIHMTTKTKPTGITLKKGNINLLSGQVTAIDPNWTDNGNGTWSSDGTQSSVSAIAWHTTKTLDGTNLKMSGEVHEITAGSISFYLQSGGSPVTLTSAGTFVYDQTGPYPDGQETLVLFASSDFVGRVSLTNAYDLLDVQRYGTVKISICQTDEIGGSYTEIFNQDMSASTTEAVCSFAGNTMEGYYLKVIIGGGAGDTAFSEIELYGSVGVNWQKVGNVGPEKISDLDDVPTLVASKLLKVNSAGNAIEYIDERVNISDLGNVPALEASKLLKVNSGGTAVEYVDQVANISDLGDVPALEASKLLKVNSAGDAIEYVDQSTNIVNISDLADVPTLVASKLLKVNSAGDAVEYVDQVANISDLADVPALVGDKILKVNSGGTAVEYVDERVNISDLADVPALEANKLLKVNSGGTAIEYIETQTIINDQTTFDAYFNGTGTKENANVFIVYSATPYLLNHSVDFGSNFKIDSDPGVFIQRNGQYKFTSTGTSGTPIKNIHFTSNWSFDGQGGIVTSLPNSGGSTTYTGFGGFASIYYVEDSIFECQVMNSVSSNSGGAYYSTTNTNIGCTIKNVSYCSSSSAALNSCTHSNISNIHHNSVDGLSACHNSTIDNIYNNTTGVQGCKWSTISNVYDNSVSGVGSCNESVISNVYGNTSYGVNGCPLSDISLVHDNGNTGVFNCDHCTISNVYSNTAANGGGCDNCNNSTMTNIFNNIATVAGGGCYNCTDSVFFGTFDANTAPTNKYIDSSDTSIAFAIGTGTDVNVTTARSTINWN